MNRLKAILTVAFLLLAGVNLTNAQSLGDLLGKLGGTSQGSGSQNNNGGNILTNLLEGVFSSSNITVADLAGEWTANGPAVCFQGDNFLKKAGGIAAATAIETKLNPYYQKYGLNGAKLTVDKEGNFTLAVKMLTLKGVITPSEGEDKGVFDFNFTALGMTLGSVTTYVQKTSNSLDVMFDATKIKNLLTTLSKYTKSNLIKSVGGILGSYDGLCVGFSMDRTGNAPSTNGSTDDGSGSEGSRLLDILSGAMSGNGTKATNNSNNANTNSGNSNTNAASSSNSNASADDNAKKAGKTILNVLKNKKNKNK